MTSSTRSTKHTPLNRERVIRTAVEVADQQGLDAVSMRNLSDRLGVVPMALYKHVANKDELLDEMVDVIISEVLLGNDVVGTKWKPAVRQRILATRRSLLAHPWARSAIESRTTRTPIVLGHLDSVARLFLGGRISANLTHHAMHAIGSRVWGFTQDVFDSANPNPKPVDPEMLEVLSARFPSLAEVAAAVGHESDSVVGPGCDDQFEFEFALDLLLDGIERLHKARWTPPARPRN